MIDVSKQEAVHWNVPIACKLVPGYGVPPVSVEAAVCEASEFGKEVELQKQTLAIVRSWSEDKLPCIPK